VAAAGLVALPAHADSTEEILRLRQEMARMQQSLDELTARVRELEAERPVGATGAQPVSAYVTLQRNWSEIEAGTPMARVESLLGKPERELRINGDRVWYFVYPGLGRGSVFFNDAGNVSAVQPPRLGWAW
jgi:hypothetical protein